MLLTVVNTEEVDVAKSSAEFITTTPVTLEKGVCYVLKSGTYTSNINLPAAGNDGGTIQIFNRSGETRTLTPNGSDTIRTRSTISDDKVATLIACNDGSDEWIIFPVTE